MRDYREYDYIYVPARDSATVLDDYATAGWTPVNVTYSGAMAHILVSRPLAVTEGWSDA